MQSKWKSFEEQVLNVGTGAVLSYLVWQEVVLPLVKIGCFEYENTVIITGIFTVTSFIRSYVWRRIYNKFTHASVA